MRQRVMIAMAVACRPRLLVADEPTTALDVTVQAGILDVLRDLRAEIGTAILLITHDLGVVADIADRVVVMYAGRTIEEAGTEALFARHSHPYTRGLLDAVPNPARHAEAGCARSPAGCRRCAARRRVHVRRPLRATPTRCAAPRRPRLQPGPAGIRCAAGTRCRVPGGCSGDTALEVVNLVKHFGPVRAVDGVSLTVAAGEVLGLVGESGSGKTTLGRCVTRLVPSQAATCGSTVSTSPGCRGAGCARCGAHFNIVFQDPSSSLNPRMTVADIIARTVAAAPDRRLGRARPDRVAELLDQVGLQPDVGRRYPHELSGGQRQRVSLARALSAGPSLLVADEPTSALDVSVQASVLNLIGRLQSDLGFACLFITHDLAAVEFLAQRVAVMYLGVLVEVADRARPVRRAAPPLHAGAAVGRADPRPGPRSAPGGRIVLSGEVPSPIDPPSGCRFHPRCPVAVARCSAGGAAAAHGRPGLASWSPATWWPTTAPARGWRRPVRQRWLGQCRV